MELHSCVQDPVSAPTMRRPAKAYTAPDQVALMAGFYSRRTGALGADGSKRLRFSFHRLTGRVPRGLHLRMARRGLFVLATTHVCMYHRSPLWELARPAAGSSPSAGPVAATTTLAAERILSANSRRKE